MFCPQCRYEVGNREEYCPRCGAHVATPAPRSLSVTFVESDRIIAEVTIQTDIDARLTYGRAQDNDIVVKSHSDSVSEHHGYFDVIEGQLFMTGRASSGKVYYNGIAQDHIPVTPGDIVMVGETQVGMGRIVAIVGEGDKRWKILDLSPRQSVSIGRHSGNDLVLRDSTVSACHAFLERDYRGLWSITDVGSSNGTRVDGIYISGPTSLPAGAVIMMGNSQLIFLGTCLLVVIDQQGVEVVATDLVRYREKNGVKHITCDHISLRVKRGEFVAIVGGSGCGKSTLLNALSGFDYANEGTVLLDGTNLYANCEMMRSSIGYVPQEDIVYDDLALYDMLESAAKLRMQPDITKEERSERVEEVMRLLELTDARNQLIGSLPSGQKKRASIAVELLIDPRLLFLDEPTSGLDPGMERKLMATLAEMAHEGRTIIVVTHNTTNLHLCDQVVFLGEGGKLCFAGPPKQALVFFGVTDFVDAYNLIVERPEVWEQKNAFHREPVQSEFPEERFVEKNDMAHGVRGFMSQLGELAVRCAKLMANDRGRFALLLLQAPLLALFIALVTAKGPGTGIFYVLEDTKASLFALSCAAFWVGILNSIQAVCKEWDIVRREHESGVRVSAYVFSKFLILALLCIFQSLSLVLIYMPLVQNQPQGTFAFAYLDIFVTTFLTTMSATCLGLLASAVFKKPDKAMAMIPLLVMPQIMLSGVMFALGGVASNLSYAMHCHWAMEAYGTIANLNDLDPAVIEDFDGKDDGTYAIVVDDKKLSEIYRSPQLEKYPPKDKDKKEVDWKQFLGEVAKDQMYGRDPGHLFRAWGILAAFSIVEIVGCMLVLKVKLRR